MLARTEERQIPVSSLIACVENDLTPRENTLDVFPQMSARCRSKRI